MAIKQKYILFICIGISLFTFLAIVSCKSKQNKHLETDHHSHEGHDHDSKMHSVIAWEDGIEFFAEWEDFVAGKQAKAFIHLTDLTTSHPVENSKLTVLWQNGTQSVKQESFSKLLQPGIYKVMLSVPTAGVYDVIFKLERESIHNTVHVKSVKVFGSEENISHDHESEHSEGIVFLKEQQWLVDFATVEVSDRTMYENVRAFGEIKAAQFAEAEVFAPFDGVLMPDLDHGVVRPGQKVSKGEVIAELVPHGGLESGWSQLVNNYELSKTEYERVKKLSESDAVSRKRFQESAAKYQELRGQILGALRVSDVDLDKIKLDGNHYHLRVPASGVLADFHLRFGQHVEVGEQLFSVINSSLLWLEAQVSLSDANKIDDVHNASFMLNGQNRVYTVSEFDGKLISVSKIVDPQTRRLPVIFELRNNGDLLKTGSYAQVFLKTKSSNNALAVPESALLDEDGTSVVYVQTGGESFEKRIVKTGVKDEGFIEIKSGLKAGERIVSTGAYKVRLASLKINPAEAGHGHAH